MPSASGTAIDDSGYTIVIASQLVATVYSRSGMTILVPLGLSPGSSSITDPNNNTISASVVSNTTTYTDTLGTPLTVNTGSTSTTYKYPSPPNGTQVSYTVNYSSETVQTNFGCSGISEYGPASQNLVSSITLPDSTSYSFTYEATPGYPANVTGRLASVTLPTGGKISYSYSGGSKGITCNDGSTATLERSTPDTGSNYWTYAHTESGSAWSTTVTDPQGNPTDYNFQGVYETERQVYSGSSCR